MNPVTIAAFVLFDVVVTAIVLTVILRRRTLAAPAGNGLDLRKVIRVSRDVEARTDEYMKANWSGDPSTLATAITSLLDELDADLRSRGISIERTQLRVIVGRLLETRGLAKGQDVREAMRQVA